MSDAMTVSYDDSDAGGYEWDEVYWCVNCGRDRLLGMELVGGRVMGTCEFCQQRADYTPPDDDEVIAFCDSPECRCLSTFAYDQNEDNGVYICGFCGSAIDSDALTKEEAS